VGTDTKIEIDLKEKRRIVLVGAPNVGKSVIFNVLTGTYVTVSNYPGTTVEVTQGLSKFDRRRDVIIDSPGVNSLVPKSEDERVTRDILVTDTPDAVVQVIDAKTSPATSRSRSSS
jgi:ferrous iron transport protein B